MNVSTHHQLCLELNYGQGGSEIVRPAIECSHKPMVLSSSIFKVVPEMRGSIVT